ncbi:MAG TPA: hypothetical protein VI072_36205 [Polyangiaceae bacterium]
MTQFSDCFRIIAKVLVNVIAQAGGGKAALRPAVGRGYRRPSGTERVGQSRRAPSPVKRLTASEVAVMSTVLPAPTTRSS